MMAVAQGWQPDVNGVPLLTQMLWAQVPVKSNPGAVGGATSPVPSLTSTFWVTVAKALTSPDWSSRCLWSAAPRS